MQFDLREQGHRVAKATIYRTLPLLMNCGIVKQVQLGNKQAYYEHTYGQDPHDHMVCRRCSRIVEFDSARRGPCADTDRGAIWLLRDGASAGDHGPLQGVRTVVPRGGAADHGFGREKEAVSAAPPVR